MGKKDFGEPLKYDPEFKGPIHNRSCTDVFWLLLFIAYIGVWLYIGHYGMKNGNIEKLLAPMDSKGRHCGLDNNLQNKKKLVFFDITKCLNFGTPFTGCKTPQVCVEKCPQSTIMFKLELSKSTSSIDRFRYDMICIDKVTDSDIARMSGATALRYIEEEKCAPYVLASKAVLNRCIGDLSKLECKDTGDVYTDPRYDGDAVCVRNPKRAQRSLLKRATAFDSYVGWIAASWVTYFKDQQRETHIVSAQIVQDLVAARWYMLGALGGVVVVCFVYIMLLRWVVAPMVWASLLGFLALLSFSVYLSYKNYRYYVEHPVTIQQTSNLEGYLKSYLTKSETWLAALVALSVLLVVMVLVVLFLRSRISISIALIQEGSKAVSAVKSAVALPLFPWGLQCAALAYGLVVFALLRSVGVYTHSVVGLEEDAACDCGGKYTQNYVSCEPSSFDEFCRDKATGGACFNATCYYTGINNPPFVQVFLVMNLLGVFWTASFVSGVADMILASTFSTWYWTFHRRNLPFFTLTTGIFRTLRYHLGTVALGALVISIVRVIRVIIEYIDHKVKKFDNAFTRCILCCCRCFFWCLENFLKFINKNAYIMCAVHGTDFCTSARDAFSLLMRNIIRVVVLDKVTDFVFLLSKLLISVGVALAVYYGLEKRLVVLEEPLYYHAVPAVVLGLATYLVSTIFFNVYSMAVDTLFLCFLEDCERNDGSPEKPYFMPKKLMKILGKRNKHQ